MSWRWFLVDYCKFQQWASSFQIPLINYLFELFLATESLFYGAFLFPWVLLFLSSGFPFTPPKSSIALIILPDRSLSGFWPPLHKMLFFFWLKGTQFYLLENAAWQHPAGWKAKFSPRPRSRQMAVPYLRHLKEPSLLSVPAKSASLKVREEPVSP